MINILQSISIPLIIITISSLAVSVIIKKKFYETLPAVVGSIILMLYIAYITNWLVYSKMLILGLSISLVIFALIKLIKNASDRSFLRKAVYSPTLLIYLFLIVLFAFFAQNRLVGLWDELRLWGAYPKALHTYASLQLGDNAVIYPMMQSYPPAMPLLGYFFTCFSPVFNESVLFVVYAFLGMVFMLPFTKYLEWSKWYNIVFTAFIIIFFPYIIYSLTSDGAYYYKSLFIDSILGIYFGYCMYSARENCYEGKFKIYEFFVLLACLVLLKDSGLFFAVMCLVTSLVYFYQVRKTKALKKFIVGVLLFLFALGLSHFSWSYMIKMYGIENHLGFTEKVKLMSVLRTIIVAIVGKPIYLIAFIVILACAIGEKYLCYRLDNKDVKIKNWTLIMQIVTYIGFLVGYIYVFRHFIANGKLPSFRRYMSTLVIGELYLFISILIHKFKYDEIPEIIMQPIKKNRDRKKVIFVAGTLCIIIISSLLLTQSILKQRDRGVFEPSAEIEAQLSEAINNNDNEDTVNVYLVSQGTPVNESLLHHRIYFNLIDEHIMIKNFYIEININPVEQQDFINRLVDGNYKYIFLIDSHQIFVDNYGGLFGPELTVESTNQIYSVEYMEGDVSLTLIK
ncbi:MAG: hypothetical protein AB1Z23_09765 [Eubacteriales bacterium]